MKSFQKWFKISSLIFEFDWVVLSNKSITCATHSIDSTPSIKTKPIFGWKKKMRGEKRNGKWRGGGKNRRKRGSISILLFGWTYNSSFFILYYFSSTLLSFSLFSFFQTKQAISKMKWGEGKKNFFWIFIILNNFVIYNCDVTTTHT